MPTTAELRWFWNSPQEKLKDWFCSAEVHGFDAGDGGKRTDYYLRDSKQPQLGIKRRGGKNLVEIKGLVTQADIPCELKPFIGPIEIWTKWSSDSLILDMEHTVAVEKQRWLRSFDTSKETANERRLDTMENLSISSSSNFLQGCNAELTWVRFLNKETLNPIEGPTWLTFSFESYGSVETVESSLRKAAIALAKRNPPDFTEALVASYPAWLCTHAPEKALV